MSPAADDGVLRDLVPRNHGTLLDEVARISKLLVSNNRPRPDVELGLTSGQLLRGKVIAVEGGVVMLHTGGNPRAPSVAYVRVDQIAVISIPDASVLAHEPVLASDAPVPSRLELARRVAGLMPPIAFAPELDDGARRAVGAFLPLLQHALSEIANDAMGKGALTGIDGIDLSTGTTGHVTRDGRRIAIHAPILVAEAFTLGTLRSALERVL